MERNEASYYQRQQLICQIHWPFHRVPVNCALPMPELTKLNALKRLDNRYELLQQTQLIHLVWLLRQIDSTGLIGLRTFDFDLYVWPIDNFVIFPFFFFRKKIESTDQNGSRYPGIASPLFGNHKMYGLTAVTEDCPLFFSPCQNNNGNCPAHQICLVNPISPSGQSCFNTRSST